MENEFKECHLIADECRGIYIPQYFSKFVDLEYVQNGSMFIDDLAILELGPDHEHYWDAWQNILDNMKIYYQSGTDKIYSLYQDGSLFAVIYND